MNKSDLIEAVASELESSKAEASKMIEAVINAISEGLKTEEKVAISGVGTFTKKQPRSPFRSARARPARLSRRSTSRTLCTSQSPLRRCLAEYPFHLN